MHQEVVNLTSKLPVEGTVRGNGNVVEHVMKVAGVLGVAGGVCVAIWNANVVTERGDVVFTSAAH